MTPEEFEKIKQAEKEHLRKVRKLKNTVRQLERQKKISGAISDMTSSMTEKFDVHDDMVQRLAIDNALNEARLEIALEQSEEADKKAQLARDEEDLAQLQARQVVGQMRETAEKAPSENDDSEKKASEGRSEDVSSTTKSTSEIKRRTPLDPGSKSKTSKKKDELPEKTIGRMGP